MESTESSVSSIVAAFSNGLNVFKRLRKCRQGHKVAPNRASCKHSRSTAEQKRDQISGEELRLSKSLRRGSADVQKAYEANLRRGGTRYAAGDGKS